jgi:hypothetical protein
LLPYIERRDAVSNVLASKDSELRKINDELTAVQVESIQINSRNVELASEVLELAETSRRNASDMSKVPKMAEEIARLEAEVKASRQKWKVIKGTASAIVAGSGVDWMSDAGLRDIVLDPD